MMRVLTAVLVLVAGIQIPAIAQTTDKFPQRKTIVLMSPFDVSGRKTTVIPNSYGKNCMNLITLELGCGRFPSVDFGTRIGKNINLFKISGATYDQTRMVRIGEHKWTDNFLIPDVEPWAPLAPGERRNVVINASGADGADGKPGRSGDGTFPESPRHTTGIKGIDYANAPVGLQVTSSLKNSKGKYAKSDYSPIVEARKGSVYVVRVVEQEHDHYVVIRVDEIEDGKNITLSYFKIQPPVAL